MRPSKIRQIPKNPTMIPNNITPQIPNQVTPIGGIGGYRTGGVAHIPNSPAMTLHPILDNNNSNSEEKLSIQQVPEDLSISKMEERTRKRKLVSADQPEIGKKINLEGLVKNLKPSSDTSETTVTTEPTKSNKRQRKMKPHHSVTPCAMDGEMATTVFPSPTSSEDEDIEYLKSKTIAPAANRIFGQFITDREAMEMLKKQQIEVLNDWMDTIKSTLVESVRSAVMASLEPYLTHLKELPSPRSKHTPAHTPTPTPSSAALDFTVTQRELLIEQQRLLQQTKQQAPVMPYPNILGLPGISANIMSQQHQAQAQYLAAQHALAQQHHHQQQQAFDAETALYHEAANMYRDTSPKQKTKKPKVTDMKACSSPVRSVKHEQSDGYAQLYSSFSAETSSSRNRVPQHETINVDGPMGSPSDHGMDYDDEDGMYGDPGLSDQLGSLHLRKAKLLFFYARSPQGEFIAKVFPDVQFHKGLTTQAIKWFSNFREFFYAHIFKWIQQQLFNHCDSERIPYTPEQLAKIKADEIAAANDATGRTKVKYPRIKNRFVRRENHQFVGQKYISPSEFSPYDDSEEALKDLEMKRAKEVAVHGPEEEMDKSDKIWFQDPLFVGICRMLDTDKNFWNGLISHYKKDSKFMVPESFKVAVRRTIREMLKCMLDNKHLQPSWRKDLYKYVNTYDRPFPEMFSTDEWLTHDGKDTEGA